MRLGRNHSCLLWTVEYWQEMALRWQSNGVKAARVVIVEKPVACAAHWVSQRVKSQLMQTEIARRLAVVD